jgi:hypothetical protein
MGDHSPIPTRWAASRRQVRHSASGTAVQYRRQDSPLRVAAGMIRLTTAVTTINTISNGSEPKFSLDDIRQPNGCDRGEVAVIEVREDWLITRNRKSRPPRPARSW